MGGKGIQQAQQDAHVALCHAVGGHFIDSGHHGGDGGVHLQGVNIVSDLLDGLVEDGLVGRGQVLAVSGGLRQIPHLVQKALGALHGIG